MIRLLHSGCLNSFAAGFCLGIAFATGTEGLFGISALLLAIAVLNILFAINYVFKK